MVSISPLVFWNMNRNIVFDTHIQIEEKEICYRKLCLPDKQLEREILMLRSQSAYFLCKNNGRYQAMTFHHHHHCHLSDHLDEIKNGL